VSAGFLTTRTVESELQIVSVNRRKEWPTEEAEPKSLEHEKKTKA
jgi:hypothetical protein